MQDKLKKMTEDEMKWQHFKKDKINFKNPIAPECVREMEKHSYFDKKTLVTHFDKVAINYDDCQNSNDYPDPGKVANEVENWAQKRNLEKEKTKIIDFGCGTGLVG